MKIKKPGYLTRSELKSLLKLADKLQELIKPINDYSGFSYNNFDEIIYQLRKDIECDIETRFNEYFE